MKKLFAIIILISTLCLFSCNSAAKSITVEETDDIVKITLDNFIGEKKIKLSHDNTGECSLYYKTNITSGEIDVSYDWGLFFDDEELFEAETYDNATGGIYVDSSVSKVTIILDADEITSGEIYFAFSQNTSPFKAPTEDELKESVVGKTFLYEKPGFWGDFTITIYEDGTFFYYEGMASSYHGIGEWEINGTKITLTDKFYDLKNTFAIKDGSLFWLESKSTGFLYLKVENGDAFHVQETEKK